MSSGQTAPTAVRIQHKGRTPGKKIPEYQWRNREVQTQIKENQMTIVWTLERNETIGGRGGREKTKRTQKERARNTLTKPRYETVLVRRPSQSVANKDRVVRRVYLKNCILQEIIITALPPRIVSHHGVEQAESIVVRKGDKRWHENQTKGGGITRDTSM